MDKIILPLVKNSFDKEIAKLHQHSCFRNDNSWCYLHSIANCEECLCLLSFEAQRDADQAILDKAVARIEELEEAFILLDKCLKPNTGYSYGYYSIDAYDWDRVKQLAKLKAQSEVK
jgi:hypothetical protein